MAPPDILLLVLDTARADAFAPWGGPDESPTLERLCAEGTWFERAVSPAPWTLPSTASVLSGVLPSEHLIDARAYGWRGALPTSPAPAVRAFAGRWLPEAFAARGYDTWAVSCNPWVSTWGGFGRGFRRFADVRPWDRQPRTKLGWGLRRVREVARADHGGRRALRILDRWSASREARPVFAFVDLMEMHTPYDPPWREHPARSGGRVRDRAALGYRQLRQSGFQERPDETYLEAIRGLYRAGARVTDQLTGSIIRAFVSDARRPVAVVVVSDHGENLGEHGLFEHHSSLHETVLHVPLVLWGRDVDVGTGAVSAPASILGIADWVEELADGGSGPPDLSGLAVSEYESTRLHMRMPRELAARTERDGPGSLPGLVDHAGLAVRDGALKYVSLDDRTERLHDLTSDPGEDRDLLEDAPHLAERFRGTRDAWLGRLRERPSHDASGDIAEREIADHLRRLGYID